MAASDDRVFRSLADPTRRRLLDRLHEEDGQTLGQLVGRLGISRQGVTQHLDVLERAGLVTSVHRGRVRLHYLNPVAIHGIAERWIDKFDRERLEQLSRLKRRAEEKQMSEKPTFVYVTYIAATPERVYETITDAELTASFWGHSNVSEWKPGSHWEHRRVDGSDVADVVGHVVDADPPTRLVLTFGSPAAPEEASLVTFEIEPYGSIVRLRVIHEDLPGDDDYAAVANGWPAVLANLKSLLETGSVMPEAPWEMHASERNAHMAGDVAGSSN